MENECSRRPDPHQPGGWNQVLATDLRKAGKVGFCSKSDQGRGESDLWQRQLAKDTETVDSGEYNRYWNYQRPHQLYEEMVLYGFPCFASKGGNERNGFQLKLGRTLERQLTICSSTGSSADYGEAPPPGRDSRGKSGHRHVTLWFQASLMPEAQWLIMD